MNMHISISCFLNKGLDVQDVGYSSLLKINFSSLEVFILIIMRVHICYYGYSY
jgi:hypothetical protein